MRYIQPNEAVRLLRALCEITDSYYNLSDDGMSQGAYIKYLESILIEIAELAQSALEEIYDVLETEPTKRA